MHPCPQLRVCVHQPVLKQTLARCAQVAFMVKHCTGIVCCPMDEAFCDRLKLPLMVEQNEEYFGTKFCVTVDGGPARHTLPADHLLRAN